MPQLRMRAHMRDACKIGTADDSATGPSPHSAYSYAVSAIRCRFMRVTSRETVAGVKTTVTNTKIALPLGTVIKSEDRLQLTLLNGSVPSPDRFYAITGEPQENGAEIIVDCTRLIGASEK